MPIVIVIIIIIVIVIITIIVIVIVIIIIINVIGAGTNVIVVIIDNIIDIIIVVFLGIIISITNDCMIIDTSVPLHISHAPIAEEKTGPFLPCSHRPKEVGEEDTELAGMNLNSFPHRQLKGCLWPKGKWGHEDGEDRIPERPRKRKHNQGLRDAQGGKKEEVGWRKRKGIEREAEVREGNGEEGRGSGGEKKERTRALLRE